MACFRGETCSCVCVWVPEYLCVSVHVWVCSSRVYFSRVGCLMWLILSQHNARFLGFACSCVKIITPDLFVPHTPSSVLSLPFVSARLALCLYLGWMDSPSYAPVPRTLWGAATTPCHHWQAAEAMSVWREWVLSALNLNTLLHRK